MSRNISELHPRLQVKVAALKAACEAQGLKIGISECLRTVAEQDALYAKGRTTSGSIVTNAKGSSYSSMHQWGVAFDFYRNDGTGAYNDSDGFFTNVGRIGKSIGLEWGGDWTSIKDKPHFQLPDWGSTPSKLKATYGTPSKFMATWNSDEVSTTSNTSTSTSTTTSTSEVKYYHDLPQVFSQHVKDLQGALNADYNVGLATDGIYGQKTEAALQGVNLSTKSCRKTNGTWLRTNTVAWVQCRVGATTDGKYGNGTATKVKEFQAANGLATDGIAGINTIRAILNKCAW